MATSRDDIQDATGKRSFISGRGATRAYPMDANVGDYNATTGAPTNNKAGYCYGCIWQNVIGSGAGAALYVNVGTVTSATWVNVA